VPHPQRCVQAVRVHAATSASLRFGKIEGRPPHAQPLSREGHRGECYFRRTRWHSFHTIPIPARKNPTNLDPYFLRGRPKPVFEIASKCAGCRFRRTNGTLTTWNGRYEESSTGFSRIFVRTSGHVLSNSQTRNGTSKSLPNLPSSYGWGRLRPLQTDTAQNLAAHQRLATARASAYTGVTRPNRLRFARFTPAREATRTRRIHSRQ
jgi:hypothetical protein